MAAKKKAASPTPDPGEGPAIVRLKRLEDKRLDVEIVGVTPIIVHKWSEKALQMMRDKQMGTKIKAAREAKNPEQEAEGALYRLPDGTPGMPATAFKSAIIDACRFFEGVTMVMARTLIYVQGQGPQQLVPINGTLHLREDMPRLATGVTDLRYRYELLDWSATLSVCFLPSQIDAESIVALVDAGGRGGVGDWRPTSPKSKTGIYGTWRVKD